MSRAFRTLIVLFALAPLSTAAQDAQPAKIDFNRQVRPILSDKCFVCHGPDSASRKAELRLDLRDDAIADRKGDRAIVPGNSGESEAYRRVMSDDAEEHMPPVKSGLKLTSAEKEVLKKWIDQGAEYQAHWAFPPQPPAVAKIRHEAGAVNPIDHFVRARLESEGLAQQAEADKATLIRRVTFDLTGLPPTPAEVDDFLRDTSSAAYEHVVDRLLRSLRYGERMANAWLDAARYADTNGYQSDEQRHMWRWRDWVIEAYNKNMPFDQFTIEQLAGDLLPNPRLDQIVATGFNRNHRANSEGGIIPAEFLLEYAVDRLDTTATVWLGLTIGCARCHDHKYDPITQKDFYRLLAFFNNVPEQGKVTRVGNAPPIIKAPTTETTAEMAQLDGDVAQAEEVWRGLASSFAAAQAAWEKTVAETTDEELKDGLVVHFPLDGDMRDAMGEHTVGKSVGGDVTFATAALGQGIDFTGDRFIDAGDLADFVETQKFSYGAWIYPRSNEAMAVLSRMDETDSYLGYDLFLDGGKVQADLVNRLLDDSIRVETQRPLTLNAWHHVLVTYDGARFAKGVRIYVDGALEPVSVRSDTLSNSIKVKQPLRIGSRGTGSQFRGLIDDVRVYNRELSAEEVATLASIENVLQIAKILAEKRTAPQAQKVQSYFLKRGAPPAMQEAYTKLEKSRKARKEFELRIPTTMVMIEKPTRTETFVLIRGEYDKPGEKVEPGLPAALAPALPAAAPGDANRLNRLALARWLVDPGNPLVARVTVNRFWQIYFGSGLVKTAEDFGSQGDAPRNQELLDWLATEFLRSGWDVKAMQKLIVMSATYRQSSKISPALLARDPDNRLLARGPRYRLSAEMIRDEALAVSGLLVEKIGGPSVKPYQPAGLWEELGATAGKYPQDKGENLYRRSLYTFWKRTIPPPSMMIFDAAGRETCSVRQVRTNTPLQALALLNDIPYVEASRGLAEQVLKRGGTTDDERLAYAFKLATARVPQPHELSILKKGLERHRAKYSQAPAEAEKLLSVGERPRDQTLDPAELAAYTVVSSVILNLDETVTKE